jgi:hypothetical protein
VLRDLRNRPGSPVTHVRPAIGVDADWYGLTSQNRIETNAVRLERARVEDVHPAWFVLGHHHRRIYELVAHHGLTRTDSLRGAARISTSTLNATIATLTTVGLITRTGRATVAIGPVSLDDVAAAHHIDEIRQARITEYRAEREQWRTWLEARNTHRAWPAPAANQDCPMVGTMPEYNTGVEQAYLDCVMATGPPEDPYADHAIELEAIDAVVSVLGGRLLPA